VWIGNAKRPSIEGSFPDPGFWIPVAMPTSHYLSACPDYFRLADYPIRTPFKLCIGSCFHLPSQVLAETALFMIQRDKQAHFCVCAGLRPSCSGRIRMANRGTLLRPRHRTNTYKSPRRMGSYDRRICPRSGGPSAACGRRRRKTHTHRTAPRC
jgi:hypothetical protein